VLSELHDRRKAWNADFSDQFPQVNVSVGFARSLEHDYVSNGWSVNTLTTFNQKNTTLLVGASGTDDHVEVFFLPEWLKKRSDDVIVGLTQLLNPLTSVSLDLTGARATGMLNEPYKLVQKTSRCCRGSSCRDLFRKPPGRRNRPPRCCPWTARFPKRTARSKPATATTTTPMASAPIPWKRTGSRNSGQIHLQPIARLYEQSAADFYYYDLDDTAIIPTRIPVPSGPNYSSDARLSPSPAPTAA